MALRESGFFMLAERRVGIAQQTVDERVKRVDVDRFLEDERGCL